jgi:hypothetical protein
MGAPQWGAVRPLRSLALAVAPVVPDRPAEEHGGRQHGPADGYSEATVGHRPAIDSGLS